LLVQAATIAIKYKQNTLRVCGPQVNWSKTTLITVWYSAITSYGL